jgi:hypothetical protein
MRRTIAAIAALAALAAIAAHPARAQERAPGPESPAVAEPGRPPEREAPQPAPKAQGWWNVPRIGLGLGIDALSLGSFIQDTVAGIPAAPVSIYFPLQVLPWLRLDPSFGAGTYQQSAAGGSPFSGYIWTVGIGALFYIVPPEPFGVYLGPRVALAFSGSKSRSPSGSQEQVRETDVSVLAAFGAEYFFVRQFALGAELRVGAYIFGNPVTTVDGVSTTLERNRIGFATTGVFFLRYFFY